MTASRLRPLHQTLTLITTQDAYIIEPSTQDAHSSSRCLVLQRPTGSVQITEGDKVQRFGARQSAIQIFGVMGTVSLLSGEYIIAITGKRKVGVLLSNNPNTLVYQVSDTVLLPVSKSTRHLTPAQLKDEQMFSGMLDRMCRIGYLYFSYNWDLTNAMQRVYGADYRVPLWKRADPRFFWNRHVQSKFIDLVDSLPADHSDHALNHFILPIICGFVQVVETSINSRAFTYSLVSRKRVHRVGTRYHSRGIDENGHVSNYVETEQVLCTEDSSAAVTQLSPELRQTRNVVMSFVQIRGSIPLFWRQKANGLYVPTLEVVTKPTTSSAFKAHVEETSHIYGGKQLMVNLINKKGYELPLGEAFSGLVKSVGDPNVRYTHFDFHQECRKMQYQNISKLLALLRDDLEKEGYFHIAPGAANSNPQLLREQIGVVRTNCIDCLDRTNVVQSMIARQILNKQMREVGILRSEQDRFEQHDVFERMFKATWADNADAVSVLYSGTGALKTDFTRTGVRTKQGALQDGYNSLMRYVKNNFLDGSLQDAFDLFLGNYRVVPISASADLVQTGELQMSPFAINNHFAFNLVAGIILSSMLTFAGIILLTRSKSAMLSYSLAVLLLCAMAVRAVLGVYGTHLVDLPRLVQLDYIVEQQVASDGTMRSKAVPVMTDVATGVTTPLTGGGQSSKKEL
ncbi:Phosphoinositide phosphatase sac1 [Sorochytrium milnesiophthora]